MTGFNIDSLLNFKPPRYLCVKCRALWEVAPGGFDDKALICSTCGIRYLPTDRFGKHSLGEYLNDNSHCIALQNPVEHGRSLAIIAAQFRLNSEYYPPMRSFYEILNAAKRFVHFTSYGISHLHIGALRLAAHRVDVRGIVSNVDASTLPELTQYSHESPKFSVKTYGTQAAWGEMPHQKLIVVDGLFAFKGSANMTANGWRKSAKGLDIIEVVTDVDEVMNLHNRYFAPLWGKLNKDVGETITMTCDIPF